MAYSATRSSIGSIGATFIGWLRKIVYFARRKPLGFFGAFILVLVVTFAIFAPLIAPYEPNFINIRNRLQGPSADHWFGTDQTGRDVFSRIVYGSRISLIVGFGAAAITMVLGTFLGVVSGYYGGKRDMFIQRGVDAFMAMPVMVVLLTAVFLMGTSLTNVTLVLGIISAPAASRVIRSATLTVMANQYIDATQAIGGGDLRIMLRHVLPNIMAPILVIVSVYVGSNVLAEAALSFLGLGVPPPTPTWGNMLNIDGLTALSENLWLSFFPGLAITMVVFSVNVIGDALRDELDPSRRGIM